MGGSQCIFPWIIHSLPAETFHPFAADIPPTSPRNAHELCVAERNITGPRSISSGCPPEEARIPDTHGGAP